MSELRAHGLTVRYGDLVALRDVDLTVAPGSLLAVTGPSGAGKSTLLWALAGAVAVASGRVVLGDHEVTGREHAAALGIGLMPQGNGLAYSLTAAENILAPLLAAGVAPTDARDRCLAALGLVGVEESGNHLVDELSGGQQQRVALARALAARPAVLLADEPTSDLDAANRDRALALLRAEAARGAVIVMATHDPEAAAQADAELSLDEGEATLSR
ncbi:ATP-binding cassette domain-containing protein [Nocardioides sp.]|uniref:ATP-binding cassette domain-containing protein n=1 Tax=Nocardioides sp. TaxID=35761 RepID=UPI0035276797